MNATTKRGLCAVLATSALLGTVGPAHASSAVYKGKTRAGNTIKLYERGGKVRRIVTGMPVTCVSINRVGESMAGADPWDLRDTFTIGGTYHGNGRWRTGLHYSEVTVNYETKIRRTRHGLKGALRETFAFMVPTYPMPATIDYGCLGVTRFTARRV